MPAHNKLPFCKVSAEASRFILAGLLLFSGFVKAVDPWGTVFKINDYLSAFHWETLKPYASVGSIALIATEFLLGVLLFMGIWRKFTAWATLLFMGAMTLLTLYIALFDPVSDCGCFGDFLKISNTATFVKNILFMIPVFFLFRYKYKLTPTFQHHKTAQYSVLVLGIMAVSFFIYGNIRHLPLFDFRPYKVGRNFEALVSIPEGAPQDKYEYTLTYKKNGEEHTFSIDSLPDDTWTYVKTNEVLVAKGYSPVVEGFEILKDGIEVTDEILKHKGNVIWVISPSWKTANPKLAPQLNELFALSKKMGIAFFAISGSSQEEEAIWHRETKAEYSTFLLDAITIKTIARANPSVLFIKDGIIQCKINAKDLSPDKMEKQITQIFTAKKPINEPILPRTILLFAWVVTTLIGYITNMNNKVPKPI